MKMSFASVPAAEAPVKFQIGLQTLIPYLGRHKTWR